MAGLVNREVEAVEKPVLVRVKEKEEPVEVSIAVRASRARRFSGRAPSDGMPTAKIPFAA